MNRGATRAKGDTREVGTDEVVLKPNGELVDGHNKKVGRKSAALTDTSLGSERSRRLSIDKDGESWSGDARMNEADEIVVQPKATERRGNEVPIQVVKGFSQVKLEKESPLVPVFEGERLDNLLGDDNVRRDVPVFDKSSL